MFTEVNAYRQLFLSPIIVLMTLFQIVRLVSMAAAKRIIRKRFDFSVLSKEMIVCMFNQKKPN